jgi:hypothetical protein
MSNQENEKQLQALLKQALGPVKHTELQRDLWPQMLRRLDALPQPFRVPWFDWALVAAVAIWFFFSPEAIPVLLYHL